MAGVAAFAIALLAFASLAVVPASAQKMNKFQQIGCYYNPQDQRVWIAGISIDPKYNDMSAYDDPDNPFAVLVKAGDQKFDVAGNDVLVHPMATFDYKGAEKYQFVKYSLVVDYSSSIPDTTRADVIKFIDEFVDKLPLAVEGQLIRFSDKVEAMPFTNKGTDIKVGLRQPIIYGLTALHDALMTAATELTQKGSTTPVRALILITDGQDTASEAYKDRLGFLSSFTSLAKQHNIAVLAIGITADRDEDLLNSITDRTKGIAGFYRPIMDFAELGKALDQVQNIIRNTVVFRIPRVGPQNVPAEVSIGTLTKGGKFTTIEIFECEF